MFNNLTDVAENRLQTLVRLLKCQKMFCRKCHNQFPHSFGNKLQGLYNLLNR